MPLFSAESATLASDGPIVQITFSPTLAAQQALTTSKQPIPTPVKAAAMIDTGASATVVKKGLLNPLGLHPVGSVPVSTPTSQNVTCATYAVLLGLPNGFLEISAVETPLQGQNIEALIGRDVLQHGLLIYNGASGQFTLAF